MPGAVLHSPYDKIFSTAFGIAEAIKANKAKKTLNEFLVYQKRLLPFFAKISFEDFEQDSFIIWNDYVTYRRQLEGDSPTSLFHDRKIFLYVLNICHRKGWLSTRYCARDFDIPFKAALKKTFLTDKQIKKILDYSLNEMGEKFYLILLLGLILGLRKQEALGLELVEINLEDRVLILKPERVKTRQGRVVPFSSEVGFYIGRFYVEAIRAHSRFLFPSEKIRNIDAPITSIKRPMDTLRNQTGVSFTFKDLRLTCSNRLRKRGISDQLIAGILGHSVSTSQRHYFMIDQEQLDLVRKII